MSSGRCVFPKVPGLVRVEIGFVLGLPESSAAAFILWDSWLAEFYILLGNEEKCRSYEISEENRWVLLSIPPLPTLPRQLRLARFRLESELCYSHLPSHADPQRI